MITDIEQRLSKLNPGLQLEVQLWSMVLHQLDYSEHTRSCVYMSLLAPFKVVQVCSCDMFCSVVQVQVCWADNQLRDCSAVTGQDRVIQQLHQLQVTCNQLSQSCSGFILTFLTFTIK